MKAYVDVLKTFALIELSYCRIATVEIDLKCAFDRKQSGDLGGQKLGRFY